MHAYQNVKSKYSQKKNVTFWVKEREWAKLKCSAYFNLFCFVIQKSVFTAGRIVIKTLLFIQQQRLMMTELCKEAKSQNKILSKKFLQSFFFFNLFVLFSLNV